MTDTTYRVIDVHNDGRTFDSGYLNSAAADEHDFMAEFFERWPHAQQLLFSCKITDQGVDFFHDPSGTLTAQFIEVKDEPNP